MAAAILPLRENFPRYHYFCDRCDKAVAGAYERGYIETAAGMFAYCFCSDCCDARRKMGRIARESSLKRALIRHGMRYSNQLGEFIAAWYGVPATRRASV